MGLVKFRPRRGTAIQWSDANPVLAEGEMGLEYPASGIGTGSVRVKFGDGSTTWNDLPYGIIPSNFSFDEYIVQNLEVSDSGKVPSVAIVKQEIDSINTTLELLDGALAIETGTSTRYDIEANNVLSKTINISKTGYTPIAVFKCFSQYQSSSLNGFSLSQTDNTLQVTLKNTTDSNSYYQVGWGVLYCKTGLLVEEE